MLPELPKPPSLPTYKISPLPEQIFLATIKGLLSYVVHLSLLDFSLFIVIVVLVHTNPLTRQKAAVFQGFVLLIFGLEVSLVNFYALLCSWLSPSTTLEPLTVVIMGVLNDVTPIMTDSVLLLHIVIERIEHAKSPLRLAMTMAVPVLLKFGRLANTAIYIVACAEFVLSSVSTQDGVPDMTILDAARVRSMQIACTLQAIDNSYHVVLYYLNAFEQRRKALLGQARSAASTTPSGLIGILLASAGTFLLPIGLSTAQLAVSRHWPDSDIPQNLEQIKVIVNVAGAATTSLVAVLNRWNLKRVFAAADVGAVARLVVADATETTALLESQTRPFLNRTAPKHRQVGEENA